MLKALTALHPDSAFGRLVRLPLRLIPAGHVTTVRGGINQGFRWVVGSSIHGCWLGTYEHDKQALVATLAQPGMVVWDVGANAGFYTLAFSRLVGPSGRVFAFEPFAENVENLLAHLRLNKLSNTKIIQVALAGQTGLMGFSVAELNTMGHLSAAETSYLVPTLSMDEFIVRQPGAVPDLIKIDVEGAEAELLAGATRLLGEHAPKIVLALHGEEQARECSRILLGAGYALFYLDGSPAGGLPLRSDEIYAQKGSPA